MMKKILVLGVFALFFAACENGGDNSATENDNKKPEAVETVKLTLANFDSLAGNYVGKEVSLSGVVDHVCKRGGKKFLLVEGDNEIHVFNKDDRFDEALCGSKVVVKGIVEEQRVDSAFLAERLEHEQKSHADDADQEHLQKMTEYINKMQDSLKKSGLKYFSNFSLKYISLEEEKTEE